MPRAVLYLTGAATTGLPATAGAYKGSFTCFPSDSTCTEAFAVKLNGTGTTSRNATLTTTMTVRVVRVMPGGLLLIQGDKHIQINSETQVITIRGLVRTADITMSNTVASTQIADMEVTLNGKGIVADAVRRPNVLYRILLGILPF